MAFHVELMKHPQTVSKVSQVQKTRNALTLLHTIALLQDNEEVRK